MKTLPKHGLMDSVHVDQHVTRKGMLGRLMCSHSRKTTFLRIDHRSGPGWASDTYQGTACVDCGKILSSRQTY